MPTPEQQLIETSQASAEVAIVRKPKGQGEIVPLPGVRVQLPEPKGER